MKIHLKDKVTYGRMILPAFLVLTLVGESLYFYEAPSFDAKVEAVAESAVPASANTAAGKNKVKAPKLDPVARPAETRTVPAGTAQKLAQADESGEYKDGTYTGTAQGFGGPITVSVMIKDGKITDVSLVSAPNEDAGYLNKAKSLLGTIKSRQSTNVDAVSGATYSSNGIIMAARNALAKASGKSSGGSDSSGNGNSNGRSNGTGNGNKSNGGSSDKSKKKPTAVTGGDWADGTFTGTGEGFEGPVTVAVTIRNGKITKIKVKKTEDDEPYFTNAKKGIVPAVIKAKGTNVDTVSGATYSSVGLLQAINDALKKSADEQKKKSGGKDDTDKPGTDDPGTDKPGTDDPGKDDPGTDDPGKDDPGKDDPGTDDPGKTDPPQESQPVSITKTFMVYCDDDEDFDDYSMSATFIIKDGVVTDITNAVQTVPEKTNNAFIRSALNGIKAKLVGKSSADGIDAVSGATCTSASLIEAAKQALEEARQAAAD